MQKYDQEPDEVLVQLYEQGDDAAFDQLLARHQQTVYSYILALVHDEQNANDVFQDVFFKAISRIRSHKYVESGRFAAWLLRIAHNQIIDTFRHVTTYSVVSAEGREKSLSNDIALSDDSVENFIINEQTYSELEQMIDRLPEPQQEVVRMRLYENAPFKEIAERTNCSINTALGRMRYAVLNLRRMAAQHDLTLL